MQKAPLVFVCAGVAMLLGACYIAGADRVACARDADVHCDTSSLHWFGRRRVATAHVAHIVDTFVRTSTSRRDWTSPAGATHNATTTNESLVAHTADGQDVVLIGGEAAGPVWDQVQDLIAGRSRAPVDVTDSYWPMAYVLGAFGLVLLAFGLSAWMADRA